MVVSALLGLGGAALTYGPQVIEGVKKAKHMYGQAKNYHGSLCRETSGFLPESVRKSMGCDLSASYHPTVDPAVSLMNGRKRKLHISKDNTNGFGNNFEDKKANADILNTGGFTQKRKRRKHKLKPLRQKKKK